MDAISLLSGLKDKVLDAKNYDLLKRTYDLQNQNIEQLKTSNTAFKENNERLKEEVNGLKTENKSLKQTVDELTQRVSQLNGGSVSSHKSSVAAAAILNLYHEHDTIQLNKESEIFPAMCKLGCSRIQFESAIDELEAAGAIFGRFKLRSSSDTVYELTNRSKKLLVKFSLHLGQFPNIFPNPDDDLT